IDTTVDLDWIWEYIHLTSEDKTRRLDLGALRDEVEFWFSPASLDLIMGNAEGETECIARDWLKRAGKRWRPFLTVAAFQGQRQLCRGQGAERCWTRQPAPLTALQVLDIFRQKTAPAFEVALRLGALYAGTEQHEEVSEVLRAYSEALGIAYQIRDDLSDL